MMYIILEDDMDLVVTVSDIIRRGDANSKKIIFLLPQRAGEINTREATIICNCMLPYGFIDTLPLVCDDEPYNDQYDQYVMYITENMSSSAGPVYMWLEIVAQNDNDVRRAITGECLINIEETHNIDEYFVGTASVDEHDSQME